MELAPGQTLEEVRFLKRYKRFLVDVERKNGEVLTVHNPNTGSMKSCLTEGGRAIISWKSREQMKRSGAKLPATLELLRSSTGWIGVNTMRTNSIVLAALQRGFLQIPASPKGRDARELLAASALRRLEKHLAGPADASVASETSGSALASDYLREPALQDRDFRPDLYWKGGLVEIKNVTQIDGNWIQFPDARSERGTRHLKELAALQRQGFPCSVVFAISRPEGENFRAARQIDSAFADALQEARKAGMNIMARRFKYSQKGIFDAGPVSIRIS
ncbi:MAG: DNA/RNA nuclease SfsA [Leptospiraceae bacterium]|nr:DNA/RNA nuclease SfsA [Leptospiraceae bacterium]